MKPPLVTLVVRSATCCSQTPRKKARLSTPIRIHCPRVIVTLGKRGALGYADRRFFEVPALAGKVVDRVGAGDAFLAIAAPLIAAGAPMDLAAFVGNVAGAEAVATVGHRTYIERSGLAKHIDALLA